MLEITAGCEHGDNGKNEPNKKAIDIDEKETRLVLRAHRPAS